MRKRSEVGGPSVMKAKAEDKPPAAAEPEEDLTCPGCGARLASMEFSSRNDAGEWECIECGCAIPGKKVAAVTWDQAQRQAAANDSARVAAEEQAPSPASVMRPSWAVAGVELECPFCRAKADAARCEPIRKDAVRCPSCRSAMTFLNEASKRPKPPADAPPKQIETVVREGEEKLAKTAGMDVRERARRLMGAANEQLDEKAVAAETGGGRPITVVFGECVFRVGEFSSFRLGPYQEEHVVLPGQSESDVRARVLERMLRDADIEFERKLAWYLDKAAGIRDALKGRG